MPQALENPNQQAQEPQFKDQGLEELAEKAAVKRWLARAEKCEAKWAPDFDRMHESMKFATGLQWPGQRKIMDTEERYVNNLTLRMVEQKVAQLYARNPEAEVLRRERMDFQLWDGSIEMLQEAMMGIAQGDMMGIPNMQAWAIMQDFVQGRKQQAIIDKICTTLKKLYQYQVDCAKPEFKEQMKQLVRTVVICGVGYCIPTFVRDATPPLSTVEAPHSLVDRAKLSRLILEKRDDDKIGEEDPLMETLRSLMLSMQNTAQTNDEYELPERIEFDFPPPDSVLPDERCRSLKEFVACRYVFIRYELPADEVNAFFNLEGEDQVKPPVAQAPDQEGETTALVDVDAKADPMKKPRVKLYRVFDYTTKTELYVAKGHKKYVQAPAPLKPCVSGFWPLHALTFNDIVVTDPNSEASVFPPSDVDLIRNPQLEWNRTRDALRAQRNANAPTYLVRKGLLSPADIQNLQDREPNEVIELENLPSDMQPKDVVQVLQVAGIDPAVYDTRPLEQDMQLAAGVQQADLGPAQPNVTATVGNIAEQSRMSVTASNVDDLDGFLTRVAKSSIEQMMSYDGMQDETVAQIVGNGALMPPPEMRAQFMNMIDISIKAASSGRPNKAQDTQTAQVLAPLLMQLGGNPISIIEYIVHTLDERLDAQRFYPIPGQSLLTAAPPSNRQLAGPPASQAGAGQHNPPAPPSAVAGPKPPNQMAPSSPSTVASPATAF